MIIAIDGPAGSGKSTVSKCIAQRLGYFHLDTGAMYRALTYAALNSNVDFLNSKDLICIAQQTLIDIKGDAGSERKIYLNNEDVTEKIRHPRVTKEVKHIANIPEIREILVDLQRSMAVGKDVVLEGRDTTTVVFPNADFKIYLDADSKERARRRFIELQERGIAVTFDEILSEQQKRDESDFNRQVSPLKKSHDAIVVDTSDLTVEQVIERIVTIVQQNKDEKNWFYAVMKNIFLLLCKLFFSFKMEGRDNIPAQGGFIIASNHVSFLDPIVVGMNCPRQLHYLARTTLFSRFPFIGWLLHLVNAHPIKRGSADREALTLAEKLIKEGKGVVFFPEGTRSKDGTIGKPKSGIGFIACRTSAPVIPTCVRGTYEAMPKG
ncbi:MAG: (d)CMP kinase, partial [Candidatus Omnitrophica bacterium]|nr:(d)CMP kinase [Candidatus Omnitrophota bacterium]